VLDFVPNAVHAGIYRALAAGYYRHAGLDLRVVSPSATADPLKLVAAGRADLGLADPLDVARLVAAGRPVRAVLAIVQRPLGGVIARCAPGLETARGLEGRTVGTTGVPSDDAVLDTVVRAAGGDPRRVRRIALGFEGVQALAARRIDAFTGFWPADGPTAEAAGVRTCIFRLDADGGPRYPGLVAFAGRDTLTRRPALVRAFAAATAAGYRDAIARPAQALRDLVAANPGLKGPLVARQLAAYRPLFLAGAARFGELDPAAIRRLTAFVARERLLRKAVDPAALATNAFVPAGG